HSTTRRHTDPKRQRGASPGATGGLPASGSRTPGGQAASGAQNPTPRPSLRLERATRRIPRRLAGAAGSYTETVPWKLENIAEAEATVIIASRKVENLTATAKEFASLPGKIVPLACHVGRKEELENLVRAIESGHGPVDILVNNSATNIGQGPALEVTDEMLDKMIEINIKGALRLIRLVVPGMIERKGGGSIINVASIAGLRPQPGGLLYSFTKAGLIMMTRTWAREFGPHGVRVNAIAPGLIQTDFSEYFWKDEQYRAQLESTQPIRRIGQPDEIGHA